MIKKVIYETMEIQRGSIAIHDMDSSTATLLLIGCCSVNELSNKVNLDLILTSEDVKGKVKETLEIIAKEVPSLKQAIAEVSTFDLASDEIAKILVIFKTSLKDKEQYAQAFEYMLDYMSEAVGKTGGEQATPSFINRLAVALADPKEGTFYDGTFGLGGSAIAAYQYVNKEGKKLQIYGQEINQKTYALACIRLYIYGVDCLELRQQDVLEMPFLENDNRTVKKFDTVIMHPPFGLQWKELEGTLTKDKYARFIYGMPGMASADWLFNSVALKALNDKGKGVIITTLGALFRTGAEENLRRKLLGFDYIEAVIELPSGLMSNTGIPCAMIILNMNKSEEMKNKIQFINADELYENVRRGKRVLNEEQINHIVEIYESKAEVKELSKIIDINGLEHGNLSPSKYVMKTVFDSSAYGKVDIHLEKLHANKKLGEIGSFYRGINVTSKNTQDSNGNYKIINLADIKDGIVDIKSLPSHTIDNNARVEAYKVEAGDIIISNKGATKICIIPDHSGSVLISQNFIGIRLKSGYNPEYVKAFLESPLGEYLIATRKTGTAVAMINPKDLKEVPFVEKDIAEQDRIMEDYLKEQQCLQCEIEALQVKMNNLKMTLYDKMDIKVAFEKPSND